MSGLTPVTYIKIGSAPASRYMLREPPPFSPTSVTFVYRAERYILETLAVERAALGGILTMTMVIPKRSRVDGAWAYGQYLPVPRGSYWYNEVDATLRRLAQGRSRAPTAPVPSMICFRCLLWVVSGPLPPRATRRLSAHAAALGSTAVGS